MVFCADMARQVRFHSVRGLYPISFNVPTRFPTVPAMWVARLTLFPHSR